MRYDDLTERSKEYVLGVLELKSGPEVERADFLESSLMGLWYAMTEKEVVAVRDYFKKAVTNDPA